MIATNKRWGSLGLILLLTWGCTAPPSEPDKDFLFSIEAISQKAFSIDDAGNDSELYFVYGSRLSDGNRYHSIWTHTRRPDVKLEPFQLRRVRVPIIEDEVIQPAEYMVVNVGILDQDCIGTNRSRIARFFVPQYPELPDYTPYDQGQFTPTWARLMLTVREAPNNDIRFKVLPPEVNLNELRTVADSPCLLARADDLLGYFSLIVWNDPFGSPKQPMWDYYCEPGICRVPYNYTADTLMIHTQYNNIHDITFRITMKER